MFLICTFAGIAAGPIVGLWMGYAINMATPEQNKLFAGVLGWTLSAAAGVFLGAFITSTFDAGGSGSFSILGIAVHGAIWTAWIASIGGAAVGVYTAAVMKN